MKKLKILILFGTLLSGVFLFVGCNKDTNGGERYISENDTAYSQDIRAVSKKINANALDPKLYATRANAFYYEDKFKEALADITYASKLDSFNPAYFFKQGEYRLKLDSFNFKEARKSYEKALKLNPDFAEAGISLGKLLIARQEYNQAEVHLSDILYKDKTNAQAYFYRGISKKEQGDTAVAVDMFTQALIHNDDYLEACLQLGQLYASKKEEIALQYFNKALEIDKNSYEALYGKALYFQRDNRFKDALKFYEETVKLNPGHRLAYYNMAYINLFFQNYEAALVNADEAIAADPRYDNAYYLKGLVYEMQKQYDSARDNYAKALEINPNNARAKEYLEKLQ